MRATPVRSCGASHASLLRSLNAREPRATIGEVGVPELAPNDDQRDALAGHLDGVGMAELVRSEASPNAGALCRAAESFSGGGPRPGAAAGRSGENGEQRTDGHYHADGQPTVELFPGPVVHADLAAAAAPCHGERALAPRRASSQLR